MLFFGGSSAENIGIIIIMDSYQKKSKRALRYLIALLG